MRAQARWSTAVVVQRMLITRDEPAEILEPPKEPFDLPPAAIAPQGPTILSRSLEVEHIQNRPRQGIERPISQSPQPPVILDKPQDRSGVVQRGIHEVLSSERRDHQKWKPRPISATVQIGSRRRRPAQAAGAQQGIVG